MIRPHKIMRYCVRTESELRVLSLQASQRGVQQIVQVTRLIYNPCKLFYFLRVWKYEKYS